LPIVGDSEWSRGVSGGIYRYPCRQCSGRPAVSPRLRRIKLFQAIIRATGKTHSMLPVTRNAKDFPRDMPDIRVPCEI